MEAHSSSIATYTPVFTYQSMPYPCQDGVSVTFKIQQWLRKSKKRDTRLSVAEQSILALIPRQVGDRSEGESRARHKSLPRNTAEKAKRRRTRKFPPNVLDTRPGERSGEESSYGFVTDKPLSSTILLGRHEKLFLRSNPQKFPSWLHNEVTQSTDDRD